MTTQVVNDPDDPRQGPEPDAASNGDDDELIRRAELNIAQAIAETGRQCGSCSLCCRLLEVPEEGKKTGEWCPHCRPGHGCSIYADRPTACRAWACEWLTNPFVDDDWFPQQCGIGIDTMIVGDHDCHRFHVDPRTPNRWREEPFYSKIKSVAWRGLHEDPAALVVVSIKGRWRLILPDKEVEYPEGQAIRIVPLGRDHFEVACFETDDGARRFDEAVEAVAEMSQDPNVSPLVIIERAARILFEPGAG
jgi:hypothetical protein